MSTTQLVHNIPTGFSIDLTPGTYILGDLSTIAGPDFNLGDWARNAYDHDPSMGLLVGNINGQTTIGIIGDRGPGRYRTKFLNPVTVEGMIGLVPADLAVEGTGQAVEITGPVVYDPSYVFDLGSERKVYVV